MIQKIEGETWRQVVFDNWQDMGRKYSISNQGRLASYTKNVLQDGKLLTGSKIEGYNVLRLRVGDTYVAFLFHRLVADRFLKKPKADQTRVIHLNHVKTDNSAENLAWANAEMVAEHNKKSPAVMAYRQKRSEAIPNIKKGLKLTLAQVKQIKKMLANPNRKLTYRQMAEKYGISEMAITRIKRGENWGWVEVPPTP